MHACAGSDPRRQRGVREALAAPLEVRDLSITLIVLHALLVVLDALMQMMMLDTLPHELVYRAGWQKKHGT